MYSATAARISDGSILVFAIILWISLLLLIMYDNFREKLATYINKYVYLLRLHAGSGVKATGDAIRKEFLWRCGIPNI